MRPRFVELDDGWCLAQFAAMQCATGHQAEADATTDHATDGFETADLDADVEMAAERCCGIHGERVDRRASVEHHERMVDDVGKPHACHGAQGMSRRNDQDEAVGAIRDEFHFGAFDTFGHNADVDVAACDRHDNFRTVVFFKCDADLRMAAQKVGEIVGQVTVRSVRIGPQADMAANASGEGGEVGMHLFELRKDLPCVTQQRFAGACQRDTACLAFKKGGAECFFELPDAVAG